jgi:hypothetical protein
VLKLSNRACPARRPRSPRTLILGHPASSLKHRSPVGSLLLALGDPLGMSHGRNHDGESHCDAGDETHEQGNPRSAGDLPQKEAGQLEQSGQGLIPVCARISHHVSMRCVSHKLKHRILVLGVSCALDA